MGPVFGRVDLEMAIHAEAFAGGAEQRQENDGEGVQAQTLAVGRAVTPIISEVKGVNRVVYDPTSKPLGRSSGSYAALSPCELIGEQRDRPGVDRRRIPFEDG